MPRPVLRVLRRRQALFGMGVALMIANSNENVSNIPLALGIGLLALFCEGRWRVATRPSTLHSRSIASFTDCKCKLKFNFTKSELYRLMDALNIPDHFRDRNRCVYSGEEGFLLLLRRLNYPYRLVDLVFEFALTKSRLSMLLDLVSTFIWDNHKHLLENPTI